MTVPLRDLVKNKKLDSSYDLIDGKGRPSLVRTASQWFTKSVLINRTESEILKSKIKSDALSQGKLDTSAVTKLGNNYRF